MNQEFGDGEISCMIQIGLDLNGSVLRTLEGRIEKL